MDTTGLEPANADTNALVETGEVDSNPVATEGADSAPAAAETGKSGKPAHSADLQERFDKLTREKYEGLSRAERAEYRAQELERRLAELESTAKTQQVAPADEYPTLESVGYDEVAHRKAVDAYYANRTGTAAEQAAKRALAAEREAEQRRQADIAWNRKEAEFIKSKPDYAEKVIEGIRTRQLPITADMANAISADENGPAVAYWLAENKDKAAAIAQLPSHLQAIEIGRIAGRLEAIKAAAPPPVSKAPPPATTLNSADAARSVSTADPASDKAMSDDEWYRAELKRVARKAARK
jgi:hypothetical protein